eukprot:PhM_4_TR8397/c2_g1_i2/m.62537
MIREWIQRTHFVSYFPLRPLCLVELLMEGTDSGIQIIRIPQNRFDQSIDFLRQHIDVSFEVTLLIENGGKWCSGVLHSRDMLHTLVQGNDNNEIIFSSIISSKGQKQRLVDIFWFVVGRQFLHLLLDIIIVLIPFLFVICPTVFRIPTLITKIRRLDVGVKELNSASTHTTALARAIRRCVAETFVCVLLDIPALLCGCIVMATLWRAKRLWKDVHGDDANIASFRDYTRTTTALKYFAPLNVSSTQVRLWYYCFYHFILLIRDVPFLFVFVIMALCPLSMYRAKSAVTETKNVAKEIATSGREATLLTEVELFHAVFYRITLLHFGLWIVDMLTIIPMCVIVIFGFGGWRVPTTIRQIGDVMNNNNITNNKNVLRWKIICFEALRTLRDFPFLIIACCVLLPVGGYRFVQLTARYRKNTNAVILALSQAGLIPIHVDVEATFSLFLWFRRPPSPPGLDESIDKFWLFVLYELKQLILDVIGGSLFILLHVCAPYRAFHVYIEARTTKRRRCLLKAAKILRLVLCTYHDEFETTGLVDARWRAEVGVRDKIAMPWPGSEQMQLCFDRLTEAFIAVKEKDDDDDDDDGTDPILNRDVVQVCIATLIEECVEKVKLELMRVAVMAQTFVVDDDINMEPDVLLHGSYKLDDVVVVNYNHKDDVKTNEDEEEVSFTTTSSALTTLHNMLDECERSLELDKRAMMKRLLFCCCGNNNNNNNNVMMMLPGEAIEEGEEQDEGEDLSAPSPAASTVTPSPPNESAQPQSPPPPPPPPPPLSLFDFNFYSSFLFLWLAGIGDWFVMATVVVMHLLTPWLVVPSMWRELRDDTPSSSKNEQTSSSSLLTTLLVDRAASLSLWHHIVVVYFLKRFWLDVFVYAPLSVLIFVTGYRFPSLYEAIKASPSYSVTRSEIRRIALLILADCVVLLPFCFVVVTIIRLPYLIRGLVLRRRRMSATTTAEKRKFVVYCALCVPLDIPCIFLAVLTVLTMWRAKPLVEDIFFFDDYDEIEQQQQREEKDVDILVKHKQNDRRRWKLIGTHFLMLLRDVPFLFCYVFGLWLFGGVYRGIIATKSLLERTTTMKNRKTINAISLRCVGDRQVRIVMQQQQEGKEEEEEGKELSALFNNNNKHKVWMYVNPIKPTKPSYYYSLSTSTAMIREWIQRTHFVSYFPLRPLCLVELLMEGTDSGIQIIRIPQNRFDQSIDFLRQHIDVSFEVTLLIE